MGTMIYDIIPKNNLKILGRIFYQKRREKNYSIRGLSRSVNIAATVISDIENVKIVPNLQTLKILFKAIDVEMFSDEKVMIEISEIMDAFYLAIYYKTTDNIEKHYQAIQSRMDQLFCSPMIVEIMLFKETYLSSHINNRERDTLKDFEHWYPNMSKAQKQRYNLIRGVNELFSGRIDEAVYFLKRNLSIVANEKALAISLSYLAEVSSKSYKTYMAIQYGKEASSLHTKYNNVFRKLKTDLIVIKSLIEIGSYEEAEESLKNMHYMQNNEKERNNIKNKISVLEAYLYYRKEQFSDALVSLNLANDKRAPYYFYKADILYAQNEKIKAIETLKNNLTTQTYEQYTPYYFLSYLFLYALGESVEEQYIIDSIDYLLRNQYHLEHFHMVLFVYKITAQYYYDQNNLDEMYRIMLKMLQFIEKKDKKDT